jgi:predicted outer membrane repeat protein
LFTNSVVNFTSNSVATISGGTIRLGLEASLLFTNSTISFFNNKANGADNDIYFNGRGLSTVLIFSSSNYLTNGIRIDNEGNENEVGSNVRKIGTGILTIDGQATVIRNIRFNIEAGTVHFRDTDKSTVATLIVYNGATLSFDNKSTNTFYVTNNFYSTGVLTLNVDLKKSTADFINVAGNAILVKDSTLSIALWGSTFPYDNKVRAAILSGFELGTASFVGVIYDTSKYRLFDRDNVLYIGISLDPWDFFVNAYQEGQNSQIVSLTANIITAKDYSFKFSSPRYLGQIFTVDGQRRIVDSDGQADKAIALSESSLTFRNITFRNFVSTLPAIENYGAVFNITKSTLTFSGTLLSFTSNLVRDGNGGAIYSYYSSILFLSSSMNFLNNSASSSGGAIYA